MNHTTIIIILLLLFFSATFLKNSTEGLETGENLNKEVNNETTENEKTNNEEGTQDKEEIDPELLEKKEELEDTLKKLQFQKRKINNAEIESIRAIDMFDWSKMNKHNPVDINLIMGDLINTKNTKANHATAKKRTKHNIKYNKNQNVQAGEREYQNGYSEFIKNEFPQKLGEKYEYPEGSSIGTIPKVKHNIADVNDYIPQAFNTQRYGQKPDTGIEKSH